MYLKDIIKTQITCFYEINTFILKDIGFLKKVLINFEFLENLLNSKLGIVII
ncbi:hypothetical protein SA19223_21110 [Staphylococcus argenteus]|nr:hypothetical protein SA19223_21110 [Staphylococcus argenteus]